MFKRIHVLSLAAALVISPLYAQSGRPSASADTTANCASMPSLCREIRVGGADADSSATPKSSLPGHVSSSLGPQPRASFGPDVDGPTEFQLFVESSAGQTVSRFGYDLFRDVPSTFAPLDRVPVPADYVIGPGDELIIRAWGQVDIDARVSVDRTGQVYLPKVGPITVAGVHYSHLTDAVRQSISSVFRNFDVSVSLGQLRSIQIFVVGYARRPGSYTISALSSLADALFASGGPSSSGSIRRVQLKRNGVVVTEFDMYDLLLKGDKSKDVVLLPGDVVFVPRVGPQVAIIGSINVPGIYELRGRTTLAEQLETAGGMTSVADGQRVIVERIDKHAARMVEEFSLDVDGKSREVRDGDLIRMFAISPKFENTISLRGNVSKPGRYPYRDGMRVRDLIPTREFLLTREFWLAQDSPQKNSSAGHSDVMRNGAEINWDYAVVQRLDPVDLSSSLIPFNLANAIRDDRSSDNVQLNAGDVITVFSQRDIAVPKEHRSKYVRLEGEFSSPGVYKLAEGETLRTLVARTGGLSPKAFLFGTEITREDAQKQQQENLDRMVRDLEIEAAHNLAGREVASSEQSDALQRQRESQRLLTDRLGRLKASGRVVLELLPSDMKLDSMPDLVLENGDRIFIPTKPSTVSVVGAVYNQSSFLFQEKKRVFDYLKEAGGGLRDSDLKHAFIVRADGSVLSRTNSGRWSGGLDSIQALPGDTLVIPSRIDKGSTWRAIKDWSQIVSQFGLTAAAISVFK